MSSSYSTIWILMNQQINIDNLRQEVDYYLGILYFLLIIHKIKYDQVLFLLYLFSRNHNRVDSIVHPTFDCNSKCWNFLLIMLQSGRMVIQAKQLIIYLLLVFHLLHNFHLLLILIMLTRLACRLIYLGHSIQI